MKLLVSTIFLITLITKASAFYLNPSTGRGFNQDEINIHIASTSCAAAGFSTADYQDMIEDAVEDYWNAVPTSAIKLHVKSVGSIDITGDTFDTALTKGIILIMIIPLPLVQLQLLKLLLLFLL